ncbi:MAG: hypothetical protein M0029_07370 [Actinomycetota bacterium]|nr:hypothetical protein [Actinomycetota bacterium]
MGDNGVVALFLAAWPSSALAATLVPEPLGATGAPGAEQPSPPGPPEPPGRSQGQRPADAPTGDEAGPLADLRPVPVADRHATLLYLGPSPLEPVLTVLDALETSPGVDGPGSGATGAVVAVVGAETVALGAGALVVPVAGLDPLAAALCRLVDAAGLSVTPDGPPAGGFVGHVTVARPRRAATRRRRAAALRAASGLAVPGAGARWRVAEVVLAASEPVPDGAGRLPGGRYGIVRRVALG